MATRRKDERPPGTQPAAEDYANSGETAAYDPPDLKSPMPTRSRPFYFFAAYACPGGLPSS
jgi:hypothetical protein